MIGQLISRSVCLYTNGHVLSTVLLCIALAMPVKWQAYYVLRARSRDNSELKQVGGRTWWGDPAMYDGSVGSSMVSHLGSTEMTRRCGYGDDAFISAARSMIYQEKNRIDSYPCSIESVAW